MAAVIPPEVIRQVLEAAYGGVEKATQSQQQQQPTRVASTAPPATLSPAQQAAVAAGTAGLAAAGGAAVAGAIAARVLAMLVAAPLRLALMAKVLGWLYAAGYLMGAYEAAAAAGGAMPSWASILPTGTDEGWSPAEDEVAVGSATGGLAEILAERGIWIKEMTTTQVNRVGEAVLRSVEDGRPLSEAIAAVDAVVHDMARARLIAETEYARAMGRASMETYRLNKVPMLQWIKHPGACPACVENAAASPQPTEHPLWPNGPLPVHPHERCAVAPYYPPARRPS